MVVRNFNVILSQDRLKYLLPGHAMRIFNYRLFFCFKLKKKTKQGKVTSISEFNGYI